MIFFILFFFLPSLYPLSVFIYLSLLNPNCQESTPFLYHPSSYFILSPKPSPTPHPYSLLYSKHCYGGLYQEAFFFLIGVTVCPFSSTAFFASGPLLFFFYQIMVFFLIRIKWPKNRSYNPMQTFVDPFHFTLFNDTAPTSGDRIHGYIRRILRQCWGTSCYVMWLSHLA